MQGGRLPLSRRPVLVHQISNAVLLELDRRLAEGPKSTHIIQEVAFWIGLVILSFFVGPDVLRIWLALIGVGVPLGSYGYFAFTQKKLSPEAIYEHLLESRKKKNYREAEFEETRYERLLEE